MCGLHAVDDRGVVLTLSRSGVRRRRCLHTHAMDITFNLAIGQMLRA